MALILNDRAVNMRKKVGTEMQSGKNYKQIHVNLSSVWASPENPAVSRLGTKIVIFHEIW